MGDSSVRGQALIEALIFLIVFFSLFAWVIQFSGTVSEETHKNFWTAKVKNAQSSKSTYRNQR